MQKKKSLKQPSDYPVLRVRMSSTDEISKLSKQIEDVREHLNKNKDADQKVWMKNHVIVEALKIGLKALKK